MAITAPKLTSDFSGLLPAHIAAPVFEKARRRSAVQQLAGQIPLSPNGEVIPVVTGRPVANWVDEGATKPASQGTMTTVGMAAKKIACIVVNSMEVVEADPGGYITNMQDDLAEAFGIAFDYAALYNLGGDGTGTGPFSTCIAQTTKSTELGGSAQASGGVYQDLVQSLGEIVGDTDSAGRRFDLTGWALDTQMETRLLGQVDTTGQPVWTSLPTNEFAPGVARQGSVLGRPSVMTHLSNPANTIHGFGGDWSQAKWGVVGGIDYAVTDLATVTINGSLVSLWEKNLVAIRAEARYGFVVGDTDAFIQLRNDTGS